VIVLPEQAVTPAEVVVCFSYAAMAPGIADELKTTADTIRRLIRNISTDVITIGANLIAAKRRLDHGQFGPWLETEFQWSERSARNYMKVAEAFAGKSATVAVLPPTDLYLLAAPSTPSTVKESVVARLEQGETVSTGTIRSLVHDAKETERRSKQPERRQAKEVKLSASARRARDKRGEEKERIRQQQQAEHDEQVARAEAALDEIAAMLIDRLRDDIDRFIERCAVSHPCRGHWSTRDLADRLTAKRRRPA